MDASIPWIWIPQVNLTDVLISLGVQIEISIHVEDYIFRIDHISNFLQATFIVLQGGARM